MEINLLLEGIFKGQSMCLFGSEQYFHVDHFWARYLVWKLFVTPHAGAIFSFTPPRIYGYILGTKGCHTCLAKHWPQECLRLHSKCGGPRTCYGH